MMILRYCYAFIMISICCTGCGLELPDQYEQVEKLRGLAITFDNKGYAEAAPGDTVTVRAYFGGDTVRSTFWSLSTQLLSGTLFGPDTFMDSMPLKPLMIPGTYEEYFGNRTDSVVFNFKIPDDVIRKNVNLSQPVVSLLPTSIDNSLKQSLGSITTGQMLDIIDSLNKYPELATLAFSGLLPDGSSTVSQPELQTALSLLLQVFSVKIQIFATVNSTHMTRTFFTVRHNSQLKSAGINVEINRRPEISSISLFKVSGGDNSFDPVNHASRIKQTITLTASRSDTVLLEKGYDYYFAAGINTLVIDTGFDFISGLKKQESLYYKWFFRNDSELPGVPEDDLLRIPVTFDSSVVKITPPLDKRMTHFSVWLSVYDDLFGGRFRPRGFAFKAVHGVFKYGEGY